MFRRFVDLNQVFDKYPEKQHKQRILGRKELNTENLSKIKTEASLSYNASINVGINQGDSQIINKGKLLKLMMESETVGGYGGTWCSAQTDSIV